MDSLAAERHIYARLLTRSALATVRIKPYPVGDDFEGIVIKPYSPEGDVTTSSNDRILAPLIYQVVAVQVGGDGASASAWGREIDIALQKSSGRYAEGDVYECARTREVNTPIKTEKGVVQQIRGGLYRLRVRGA